MNYPNLSRAIASALLDPSAPKKPSPRFSITVSREAGALGNTVAGVVGACLGWPVYDHEILEKIAAELKKPAYDLRGIDERAVTWLEDCLGSLAGKSHVSSTAYLKHLVNVVRGLGLLGHCVIVGRAAHCVLAPEATLRVRLVAKLPDRIKTIADRHKVSDNEAARWIAQKDSERAEFVKTHFGVSVADPKICDLILNTSRLTADECSRIIVETLHLFEARAGEKERRPLREMAGVRGRD